MKKYRVIMAGRVSWDVVIEAKDEDEAKELVMMGEGTIGQEETEDAEPVEIMEMKPGEIQIA